MADHNKPALTDTYANFLTFLNDRIVDVFLGADPATQTVTNPPTNAIRWNGASAKWQKWNATSWVDLNANYAINISGLAATATTAAACPWSGITSKPTTLAGFGIADGITAATAAATYAPLVSPALTGTPTTGGLEVGFRVIPSIGNTATAAAAARGKVYLNTAGLTINTATFAADDVISVYNNSAAGITITQGAGFTLRQVGTANTGNRTLAQRGYATVFFLSSTEAVISGGGLT